jgi:ParB-like chromosome segregation protein Spo0J
VQRNNGTYKTITGQKRLAAARAAGLRDVPCLVHHVPDERAQVLREILRPDAPAAVHRAAGTGTSCVEREGAAANESVLEIAIAALRVVGSVSEANVSVVKTASGARLSIDLPFDPAQP